MRIACRTDRPFPHTCRVCVYAVLGRRPSVTIRPESPRTGTAGVVPASPSAVADPLVYTTRAESASCATKVTTVDNTLSGLGATLACMTRGPRVTKLSDTTRSDEQLARTTTAM